MGLYTEVPKKDAASSERSKSDRSTSSSKLLLSRHFKSFATSVSDFSERMTTRLFGFDVSSVKPSDQYEIHFIEINDVSLFFFREEKDSTLFYCGKRMDEKKLTLFCCHDILLSIMNECIYLIVMMMTTF